MSTVRAYARRSVDPRAVLVGVIGFLGLLILTLVLAHLVVAALPLAVLAACAVLMLGLGAVDLRILVMLSVPASLVMVRAGGFLSIADIVLAGATVIALLQIRASETIAMRPLIWAGVAYLACLVPTLVLWPYAADLIEWAHEAVLILGSLVVGFVIGREGLARRAYGLYNAYCVLLAVAALVTALVMLARDGHFGPAGLPTMGKNYFGDVLAFAVIFAYARPAWLGWSKQWSYASIGVFAVGIAASGSRQGMVSAAVGILVCNLRPRIDVGRRSRLVYVALVPAMIFVINATHAQLSSTNRFNSANQRLTWFGDSLDIWRSSPLFGVGLRWWYTTRFELQFQPPNAEFEMLSSGGVVGLIGFLTLFCVATWVLAKLDPRYGTLALAVVLARFTQGQLDLYWVAGISSLLWIVAGTAYGVQARDRALAAVRPAAPPGLAEQPTPVATPTTRKRPANWDERHTISL